MTRRVSAADLAARLHSAGAETLELVGCMLSGAARERADATAPLKSCRTCGAETALLVHDPDQPGDCRRTVCGTCAGNANRRILDGQNGRGHLDEDSLYGRGAR